MARNGQWQGSEGFKNGDPKRFLGSVPVYNLSTSTGSTTGTTKERLWLRGLTGNLRVEVGCGFSNPDNNGLNPNGSVPIFPANGATIQLYPFTEFNDSSRIYARPVFQDPAGTPGINTPLPQDIPFYWEGGGTEADGILIEITVDATKWAGLGFNGQLVVQVAVEYNGNWWDVAAFILSLSLPTLSGAPQPLQTIQTGGG